MYLSAVGQVSFRLDALAGRLPSGLKIAMRPSSMSRHASPSSVTVTERLCMPAPRMSPMIFTSSRRGPPGAAAWVAVAVPCIDDLLRHERRLAVE